MANATSEVIWICNILSFFKLPMPFALLFYDNQAAMHIASNPDFHERTKYIEIDCHFVRECLTFVLVTHLASTNLQTSSRKFWANDSSNTYVASWAFLAYTLQLEGEY